MQQQTLESIEALKNTFANNRHKEQSLKKKKRKKISGCRNFIIFLCFKPTPEVPLITIAALKSGDAIFFKEVFHENYERVYYYVLKKTKAEYIAEEATQLTFIRLWKYRNNLDEKLPLNIQLFRIARTTMIDLLNKQNNSRIEVAQENFNKSASCNNAWENIIVQDLSNKVIRNMHALPATRKKVFEMSRFKGMSNKEIAGILSISAEAVEFHITQALRNLKHPAHSFLDSHLGLPCFKTYFIRYYNHYSIWNLKTG